MSAGARRPPWALRDYVMQSAPTSPHYDTVLPATSSAVLQERYDISRYEPHRLLHVPDLARYFFRAYPHQVERLARDGGRLPDLDAVAPKAVVRQIEVMQKETEYFPVADEEAAILCTTQTSYAAIALAVAIDSGLTDTRNRAYMSTNSREGVAGTRCDLTLKRGATAPAIVKIQVENKATGDRMFRRLIRDVSTAADQTGVAPTALSRASFDLIMKMMLALFSVDPPVRHGLFTNAEVFVAVYVIEDPNDSTKHSVLISDLHRVDELDPPLVAHLTHLLIAPSAAIDLPAEVASAVAAGFLLPTSKRSNTPISHRSVSKRERHANRAGSKAVEGSGTTTLHGALQMASEIAVLFPGNSESRPALFTRVPSLSSAPSTPSASVSPDMSASPSSIARVPTPFGPGSHELPSSIDAPAPSGVHSVPPLLATAPNFGDRSEVWTVHNGDDDDDNDEAMNLKLVTTPAEAFSEARMYDRLSHTDVRRPDFLGLFEATLDGQQTFALLLEHCGQAVKQFSDLSLAQRISLYRNLESLHKSGYVHNDFFSRNVALKTSDANDPVLLDFTLCEEEDCPGGDQCAELLDAREELQIGDELGGHVEIS